VLSTSQFVLLGFTLGLLFGSFLNVCIARLPVRRSIVTPRRSHCGTCGHSIRWYDNVPILSWVALHARCRDCDAPIHWRYPVIELAVGLWFAWGSASLGMYGNFYTISRRGVIYISTIAVFHSIGVLQIAILGFLLIGLMVMDWQTLRLPDAFTLTGIGIGFSLTCAQAVFHPRGVQPKTLILDRIVAIAAAALILLVVRWGYKALRKRNGMGLGDVKLLAMIAAFLNLPQTLLALFVGAIAASLYGTVLLALRKAHALSRLPFGSFLAAGGLFAVLFGERVVDWYAVFFR
jgi:leader peptidase (prepilin peptidase)/N-methyltransferase